MSIIKNSAKCLNCNTEVESTFRHDYVACPCLIEFNKKIYDSIESLGRELTKQELESLNHRYGQGIAVDGGKDYLSRSGFGPYIDTSIVEE